MKHLSLWSRLLPAIVFSLSMAIGLSAATDSEDQQSLQEKEASPAESGNTKSKPGTKKKIIAKGMTAAEVIELMGKPAEVKPMEAPIGTAEAWTYRRVAKRSTTRMATGSHQVPVFRLGAPGQESTMTELDYSTVNVTYYQITAILIFNGRVEHAKQWIEKSNDFTSD